MSSKKKEKMDLSKMSAMELLLIGESQTLGGGSQEPGCSKSLGTSKGGSGSRDSGVEGNSDEEVMNMDSDAEDSDGADDENSGDSENEDWEDVDDQHVEDQLSKLEKSQAKNGVGQAQNSTIPKEGLEIVIPREGVFRQSMSRDVLVFFVTPILVNLDLH